MEATRPQNDEVITLRIPIRVRPGASRTRVGGRHGEDQLVVAVHEPPVDGAANTAVIAAVAKALGIRKADLCVISGHTSRSKVLEATLHDDDLAPVTRTLASLLEGAP